MVSGTKIGATFLMSDTDMDDIEVNDGFWGATLVKLYEDDAGMEHHWWFDLTDDGRWVLCAEIIHYDDDGRHYVDSDEMHVPPKVEAHLQDEYGIGELHTADDYQ